MSACSRTARWSPSAIKDSGFIHRLNAQWKPRENVMLYGTWSRGFRPGGINRRGDVAPYAPDFLTNYELGWKTTFGPLRWNGAIYHQLWKKFQFSFLGENSFTEIQNGRMPGSTASRPTSIMSRRSDAQCGGGLYRRQDQGNDLCGSQSIRRRIAAIPDGLHRRCQAERRLPVTPKFKGSATARYSWPAWGDVKAHVQAGVAYQGSARASIRSATVQAGTFILVDPNSYLGRIHSSTVVDLFAGLDWQRYNLEAFATNIFDSATSCRAVVNCGSCFRTHDRPRPSAHDRCSRRHEILVRRA